MRRIIAGVLAAALTACSEPAERPGQAPAGNGGVAADALDRPAANGVPADAAAGPEPRPPAPAAGTVAAERVILFVGTSLTAGYGIGADRAYPAVLQAKIDSAGLPFRVTNAGISGETSAGGLRRIDWALQQPVDVLVLELGANDGLRGLDPGQLERNLEAIIERTRATHPDAGILLLGMEAPPNLGSAYTTRFRNAYRDVARRNDVHLIPFLLEGVAGVPALNQPDGLHPTAEGQQRMAETVWRTLAPLLEARARSP